MYQITYQKKNGTQFHRYRSSLPGYIGKETSMGWLIVDIKYGFKDNYYSFEDYKQLCNKQRKINKLNRTLNNFFKKYSATIALIVLVPLYLLK